MTMQIIAKITAIITTVIFTVMPWFNYAPKADDMKMNVALISDTHIDERLPLGKFNLKRAFVDMSKNPVRNDAVVVSGDLTNYGDEESIIQFFEILTKNNPADNSVIAMGNHDIGHVSDLGFTNQEAKDWFLKHHNKYLGTDFKHNYYSFDIKDYKFIVLCDDCEDSWDFFEIYDEQLNFLDRELSKARRSGLPTFVVCHEPLVGVNGQPEVWEDGAMDAKSSEKIQKILEKYKNVFYISGHMHEGINGELTKSLRGFSCVETINGVNYISLPSYGLVNRDGFFWNGLGMQMEVYGDRVVFRARSYLTQKWYTPYEYVVELVK